MNNKVFNYLNEKKEQLSDLTEEKVTQIKAYLEKNADKIKSNTKRAVATGLVAATLLGGMAGCNNLNDPSNSTTETTSSELPPFDGPEPGSKLDPFKMPPVRDRQEIEASGISSEDVLALLDKFSEDLKTQLLGYWARPDGENTPDDYLTAKFQNIYTNRPMFINSTYDGPVDYPFYVEDDNYRTIYGNDVNMLQDVYPISFTFQFVLDGTYDYQILPYVGIYASDFEKLMETCGQTSSPLGKEQFSFAGDDKYFEAFNGQDTYAPLKIDRTFIEAASEEQLWAIYNMIDSMYSINIKGVLPEEDMDMSN